MISYISTHPDGDSHPLLLPEPKVAYVHMGDVQIENKVEQGEDKVEQVGGGSSDP